MNEFYKASTQFLICLFSGLFCASSIKPQPWLDIDCDESAARIQKPFMVCSIFLMAKYPISNELISEWVK
jgi:hypothetical protein